MRDRMERHRTIVGKSYMLQWSLAVAKALTWSLQPQGARMLDKKERTG